MGAGVSDLFYFWGEGEGVGVDGWTDDQAQTNLPFNFFDVGGITMNKCYSWP